jgi:nucleoside-diphosphate-sugar epimerase
MVSITGGAGFIGAYSADLLPQRGDKVRIIRSARTGGWCNEQ